MQPLQPLSIGRKLMPMMLYSLFPLFSVWVTGLLVPRFELSFTAGLDVSPFP